MYPMLNELIIPTYTREELVEVVLKNIEEASKVNISGEAELLSSFISALEHKAEIRYTARKWVKKITESAGYEEKLQEIGD